ncbi:unnamed protein product [Euphydryas editha]|uniref:Uncharacterized protein n=1 Tax=Euphydryas editha TaxID=104508 RepID=A0AAU9TDF3_EUPED|nr:unnamed protein product [Euphydryas editha]
MDFFSRKVKSNEQIDVRQLNGARNIFGSKKLVYEFEKRQKVLRHALENIYPNGLETGSVQDCLPQHC